MKVQTLNLVKAGNRSSAQFLEGVAPFYARLKSLQLPVLRLHSDRAVEMVSRPVHNGVWTGPLCRWLLQPTIGRPMEEPGRRRVLLKSAHRK